MPINDETLASLREAIGETHGELYESIASATGSANSELDRLRSSSRMDGGRVSELEAQVSALTSDLEKASSDLANSGSDEAIKKLMAERDAALKSKADALAGLEGLQASVHADKLHRALAKELFKGNSEASDNQRAAALKLLATDGLDGVGFDDKGNLVGHVDKLKAFKKTNPFFFGKGKPGNQGTPDGADRKPNPKGDTAEKTAYDRGRAAAERALKPIGFGAGA